jgi:hypothetical protein
MMEHDGRTFQIIERVRISQSMMVIQLLLLISCFSSCCHGRLSPPPSPPPPPPSPPPSHLWLPTSTKPYVRPNRIDSIKKSNEWAMKNSIVIPKVIPPRTTSDALKNSENIGKNKMTNNDDDDDDGSHEGGDQDLLKDGGISKNVIDRRITKALKYHPEIFPSTNGRKDDGSLAKLTESIQNVEKEEINDDGVAQHMGDSYPSIWAGDTVKQEEMDKKEVDDEKKEQEEKENGNPSNAGGAKDFFQKLLLPSEGKKSLVPGGKDQSY